MYNNIDVGFIFKQEDSQDLVGYCDSDYAANLDKGRSTSSYVSIIANFAISWKINL